jgi:hypothetical protein
MPPTFANGKICYLEIPAVDVGADAPEITARFLDPAGNVIGLYQQR